MGLLSNKIRREQLNPGDHIYIWRNGHSYSHQGIYMGDEKVIHLSRAPGLIIFSSSRDSSASHPSADRVVCCNVDEFLSGGDLYRYEYGAKTALFLIKRGGTCTRTASDPSKDVLHRASILLEKGFGDYHLFENNCEDFAIYCKTGLLKVNMSKLGRSEQIIFLTSTYLVVTYTPYHFLPSGFTSLALVVYGLVYGLVNCYFRMARGRAIVQKVAVEEFDFSHRRTVRMENGSTRRFLSPWYYLAMAILAFDYWSWTPESKILVWNRFFTLYVFFYAFVLDHLRNHRINLPLGEYVAWIIWVLGYWYWSSESGIYFWSKLGFLYNFLLLFIPDHSRSSKLRIYITLTVLWHWSPVSTILLWIRLFYLHALLFMLFPDHHMRRPASKLTTFFFASFVTRSAALLFMRFQ